MYFFFFFSSRRRHTRFDCDWSSDVCSSDLELGEQGPGEGHPIVPRHAQGHGARDDVDDLELVALEDRKSTRLNSSHSQISYAVFCLKKKNQKNEQRDRTTSVRAGHTTARRR